MPSATSLCPILQFSKVAAEFQPYRDPDDGRQKVLSKKRLLPGLASPHPITFRRPAVPFRVCVLYVRFAILYINAVNSHDSFPYRFSANFLGQKHFWSGKCPKTSDPNRMEDEGFGVCTSESPLCLSSIPRTEGFRETFRCQNSSMALSMPVFFSSLLAVATQLRFL